MIKEVVLSRRAQKNLRSAPQHVATKLLYWVGLVETSGLEMTRKQPGFHDEPLEFVSVEEVNKHDY